MAIRGIKVLSSTKSGVKLIHSEATTWGQLKDSLREFGDLDKMAAVVKETRNSLQVDEALLPEGDFTLYLSPKQIKAGVSDEKAIAIIESLKEKLNDACDAVIGEIEDGDYEDYSSGSKSSSSSSSTEIDAEDRKFLAELSSIR